MKINERKKNMRNSERVKKEQTLHSLISNELLFN